MNIFRWRRYSWPLQVREDEDDDGDESSQGSSQGKAVRSPVPKAETPQEETSKALLKQATHSNARSRNHSSSPPKPESNGSGESATQPLQSESAIEEQDDLDDLRSSSILSDLGYNRTSRAASTAFFHFSHYKLI